MRSCRRRRALRRGRRAVRTGCDRFVLQRCAGGPWPRCTRASAAVGRVRAVPSTPVRWGAGRPQPAGRRVLRTPVSSPLHSRRTRSSPRARVGARSARRAASPGLMGEPPASRADFAAVRQAAWSPSSFAGKDLGGLRAGVECPARWPPPVRVSATRSLIAPHLYKLYYFSR